MGSVSTTEVLQILSVMTMPQQPGSGVCGLAVEATLVLTTVVALAATGSDECRALLARTEGVPPLPGAMIGGFGVRATLMGALE